MASTGLKMFMFFLTLNLVIYGFAIDVNNNTEAGNVFRNYGINASAPGSTIIKVSETFGITINESTWNTTPIYMDTSTNITDSLLEDDGADGFWDTMINMIPGVKTVRDFSNFMIGFAAAPYLLTTQMNAPLLITLVFGVGLTVMFIVSVALLFIGRD